MSSLRDNIRRAAQAPRNINEGHSPMSQTDTFERPSVTTDILVFSIRENALNVLLIERDQDPFKGSWAIPGGFVKMDEDLETGALRELAEETNISGIPIKQFGAYGAVGRDPRERVITIAFIALVPSDDLVAKGGTDAKDAQWFAVDDVPPLAFDHQLILNDGRAQLIKDISNPLRETGLVAFEFLPELFTLTQAQHIFETLRGEQIDKRNFRKWLSNTWNVEGTGKKSSGGRHRPAELYRLILD